MNQFEQACKLAQDYQLAGQFSSALPILVDLACKFPEQPYPFYALGMQAVEEGQDHLAIAILQYALTLNPRDTFCWANLGTVMKRQEHIDKALHCYKNALEIDKKNPLALTNIAGCYVNKGNPQPGISYAKKALDIPGDHQKHARNTLALLLLESGDWKRGFEEYRYRSDLPNFHVRDYGAVPRWEGQKVATLAIHAEQGLGDEIMFTSCIPDAQQYADQIVAECNERNLPLLQRSYPSVRWYATHEELMDHEANGITAWKRMGDLPGWFRKSPKDCPGVPYLRADYAKVLGYRARLQAMGEGPYIGFAWLGGTSSTHRFDRRAPKEQWIELIQDAPGIKVSLQYGNEARSAKKLGLHHWQSVVDDLDETAALIMALDVVVSSPQTVIHLAGALGKRCLVALSSKPAWRYQITGPMPWYKSVELIRQPEDNWDYVFKTIGDKLADLRLLQAA